MITDSIHFIQPSGTILLDTIEDYDYGIPIRKHNSSECIMRLRIHQRGGESAIFCLATFEKQEAGAYTFSEQEQSKLHDGKLMGHRTIHGRRNDSHVPKPFR